MTFVDGRENRNDGQVRHLVGDAAPLVDPTRAFHEERFGRDVHGGFELGVPDIALFEREEPLPPGHELEDDRFDLQTDLAFQLTGRDRADLEQDLAEALGPAIFLLHFAGAFQVAFGDATGADEHRPERVWARADAGRDHATAIEQDGAFVVAEHRRYAQGAGLPTQIQQLEDIVYAQLAQRSFDSHGSMPPVAACAVGEDVGEVRGGAAIASRPASIRTVRLDLDHLFPALDRFAEP